jgi:DNA-directed RNA polymerase specialized sigma subunit
VVEDLRVLAVLRGWDKTGIPDGFRNEFVFWLSNHAALALNGAHHKRVYHEIAAELKSLVPHWHMNRIHRCLHSIYKRSKEMMKPTGWVEYQGELWPRLYTPSNETLIERLQITPEEIIQLHYIRSKETEAEQRKRKRQDHGMRSREDYLEQFEPRRKLAVDLREEGKSWQQIGDILGISRSGAYYLVSKGK